MIEKLLAIEKLDAYLVVGILLFFGIIETLSGYLKQSRRTANDWFQEFGGFLFLSTLIKPAIVFVILLLGDWLVPFASKTLTTWSLWLAIPFYLLIDDFMQYWYHRSAHEYDFFWKLHRPHHQAEQMGFFVSYRNAALYYWLMPNIWWMGIITFLGGGTAVAIGLVLKQLVIIGSHSTVKWDAPLYRLPVLRQLMFVIERIIITPAFHHAHHGKSKRDGISDPNGNYGNMFSIWDQLFGTALYTRRFPTDYGLVNDPKEHWAAIYLYPFIKSKDKNSELSKGYKKESTASSEPVIIELKKGETYLWCRCGKSKNQPFCDGSHQGSKSKPIAFRAAENGKVALCNCKLSKDGPFCDGSHTAFKN